MDHDDGAAHLAGAHASEKEGTEDAQEKQNRSSGANPASGLKTRSSGEICEQFNPFEYGKQVLQDESLGSSTKLLLCTLAMLSNDRGVSYPTQAKLAELTSLSKRTVQTHIDIATVAGYLRRTTIENDMGRTIAAYQLQLE